MLNYLAANARLSRKKQVSLAVRNDEVNENQSQAEESGYANMEDKDELARMTELAVADDGTAFQDVIDKLDLKLQQLEDHLTDNFEVKMQNMKKDNDKMLIKSMKLVTEEISKNSASTNTLLSEMCTTINEKTEDQVETLAEQVHAMDDNFSHFEEHVNERLQFQFRFVNSKFRALDDEMMRSLRRQSELGSNLGGELKQKDTQKPGTHPGKENGIFTTNSGARGHNRKGIGEG